MSESPFVEACITSEDKIAQALLDLTAATGQPVSEVVVIHYSEGRGYNVEVIVK